MKRTVEFTKAFDKRDPDPSKDYGIHGVDIIFALSKENKAVQFIIFTNWHLPNVQGEIDSMPLNSEFPFSRHIPQASDLGYHSPKPMYEGQEASSYNCKLTGGKCFYEGSGSYAQEIFEVLLREGSEGVWRELEEYYNYIFGGK